MTSEEQRARLWRAKLHSLARSHFGRDGGTDHGAPWGAAIDTDGVWTALIEVAPERSFGQALVLAARNSAQSLDLLVGTDSAAVARRARLFEPSPTVWRVDGTNVEPAAPLPLPQHEAVELQPRIAALLDIDDITIVVEHGVTTAECRGLEVGRVTGVGTEQRLDVGVGAYDQGAFAVMHPEMTPIESLAEVVAQVLTHRRQGANPHPINRLARERWIRHELVEDPDVVGLTSLEIVEPPQQRDGIKDSMIAPAVGATGDGERVLVACSVGIDLDAVPAAADVAELHATDRILIVLPDRDRHRLTQAVAAQCKRPVDFATAPEPWSAMSSSR